MKGNIIRWIAVLPCGYAAAIIVGWGTALLIIAIAQKQSLTLIFIPAILAVNAGVLVGSLVAPSNKFKTALALIFTFGIGTMIINKAHYMNFFFIFLFALPSLLVVALNKHFKDTKHINTKQENITNKNEEKI